MERKRFRVGSVAALFAVVAICVAIFSTLTVVTATSDYRVARRYGDHVADIYSCQNAGQQWLAQADAYLRGQGQLPPDSWEEAGQLGTVLQQDNMELTICIAKTDSGYEILRWSCTTQWQPDTEWELLQ